MPKFRKKPVIIEAEQWFEGKNIPGVCFCHEKVILADGSTIKGGFPHIHTLEAAHIVSPGDWIITGVKGERYPCKPDIFQMTYEAVSGTEG